MRRADATFAPLVGREEELALLLRAWRQAAAGEGQAVLLIGEAGIGKSRLLRSLRDAVDGEAAIVLLYQCSPFFDDRPLWPVLQQLSQAAGFAAEDALYIEELTKAVLEAGPDGHGAVPASLQDSLLSRLDRTPAMKAVAQIAACIGREFDHRLLQWVSELSPEELAEGLQALVAAELVFRRGTPPEASYSFKHALVRDSAKAWNFSASIQNPRTQPDNGCRC